MEEPEVDVWRDLLPPLVRAGSLGDLPQVLELLERGSSPNEADHEGWTALHASATRGHAEVVEALLIAGADVDRTAQGSVTALWNAAGPTPSTACVRLLLEAGANPNVKDSQLGWTPMSRAVDYVNIAVVELLIAAGADPGEADAEGFTLVMQAAESGSVALARMLLAGGADLHAVCDGRTALDVARERGHDDFVAAFDSEKL